MSTPRTTPLPTSRTLSLPSVATLACATLACAALLAAPHSLAQATADSNTAKPARATASHKTPARRSGTSAKKPAKPPASAQTATAGPNSNAGTATTADATVATTAAAAATDPAKQTSPPARSADYIVAIVNSEPITNNEVQARIQRIHHNLREQGEHTPPADALAPQVLEQLITEKAQLHLARETGIHVDDYAVEQTVTNIARQNGLTHTEFLAELTRQGLTQAQFQNDIRNQLTIQRLREREVDGRVRVTEQDVDQYLQTQRDNASAPGQAQALNLGHILIALPENADPDTVQQAQARALQAAQALQNGADLEHTAREYSDTRAPAIMGMRPADRYPEIFAQAVATTPVGGVAGPIRSAAGFHVLQVLDKSVAGIPAVITQSHARHILLRPTAQMSEAQAVARIAELRQRIERGLASFESLAREYSQDGSAPYGGDLGWASPGQFVPEFEQAMNALQPGDISPPVVSRFGVHLIRLDERRQVTLSPQEQRTMLRNIVREEKAEKAHATWLQELRGQAYVEYRDPPL